MINVGGIDRVARFVLGVILIALPFLPPLEIFFASWGVWKYAVAAAGAMMFGTAALRICPVYTLFGIRTCDINNK